MPDIPNDLELNQEDFSDVLPRLPDDLQDFDLFEGNVTCDYMTTEYRRDLRVASFDLGQQAITQTTLALWQFCTSLSITTHVFFRKCKKIFLLACLHFV